MATLELGENMLCASLVGIPLVHDQEWIDKVRVVVVIERVVYLGH